MRVTTNKKYQLVLSPTGDSHKSNKNNHKVEIPVTPTINYKNGPSVYAPQSIIIQYIVKYI